ncbi:MAG: hypothetical protein Q7R74_00770 [bacterium]|nr:hypothetical protein [bacterium]
MKRGGLVPLRPPLEVPPRSSLAVLPDAQADEFGTIVAKENAALKAAFSQTGAQLTGDVERVKCKNLLLHFRAEEPEKVNTTGFAPA